MALSSVYSADSKSDLYGLNAAILASIPVWILRGNTNPGDTGSLRIYDSDPLSVLTDDGENVIKPTSISGPGRIIKRLTEPGKKIETYVGTTDVNGNYSITYTNPFNAIPDIKPFLEAGTDTQLVKIITSSTTGFIVNVRTRTDTLGLLPTYSNVSGVSVSVLVTSR